MNNLFWYIDATQSLSPQPSLPTAADATQKQYISYQHSKHFSWNKKFIGSTNITRCVSWMLLSTPLICLRNVPECYRKCVCMGGGIFLKLLSRKMLLGNISKLQLRQGHVRLDKGRDTSRLSESKLRNAAVYTPPTANGTKSTSEL
jgi:hypothetical protein